MEDLKHITVPVNNGIEGANITVLDTGAVITAEDQAMLMAWHSRDPGDIQHHLAKLAEVGSGEGMDKFYVGYGHGSIGDCGNTAVFIGGVSMLVAKALQDYPLYRGQENSTRYIDFSNQPFVDPGNSALLTDVYDGSKRQVDLSVQPHFGPDGSMQTSDIHTDLRAFYLDHFEDVVNHLSQIFPDEKSEGEKWEKAIRARAFDILRGFLPAGASTGVAWNVDLRQARDSLLRLRHHPLDEVRQVAHSLEIGLKEAHPHSFGGKRYPEQEEWTEYVMQEEYLLRDTHGIPDEGVSIDISRLDPDRLSTYRGMLERRPAKSELPAFVNQAGLVEMGFMLDFASFRDIHRHRAVTIRMPEVNTNHGFENWYLDSLPPALGEKAIGLLESVVSRIEQSSLDSEIAQYAVPMGFKLPCLVAGGLPGMTYMMDLRSTTPVHPTLRSKILKAGDKLTDKLRKAEPSINLALHLDRSSAKFDTKRGDHDIIRIK